MKKTEIVQFNYQTGGIETNVLNASGIVIMMIHACKNMLTSCAALSLIRFNYQDYCIDFRHHKTGRYEWEIIATRYGE